MAQPSTEYLAAQVLVLHSAVGAIAATAPNKLEILSYFTHASDRLLADLSAASASKDVLDSARHHIADFRRILTAPV